MGGSGTSGSASISTDECIAALLNVGISLEDALAFLQKRDTSKLKGPGDIVTLYFDETGTEEAGPSSSGDLAAMATSANVNMQGNRGCRGVIEIGSSSEEHETTDKMSCASLAKTESPKVSLMRSISGGHMIDGELTYKDALKLLCELGFDRERAWNALTTHATYSEAVESMLTNQEPSNKTHVVGKRKRERSGKSTGKTAKKPRGVSEVQKSPCTPNARVNTLSGKAPNNMNDAALQGMVDRLLEQGFTRDIVVKVLRRQHSNQPFFEGESSSIDALVSDILTETEELGKRGKNDYEKYKRGNFCQGGIVGCRGKFEASFEPVWDRFCFSNAANTLEDRAKEVEQNMRLENMKRYGPIKQKKDVKGKAPMVSLFQEAIKEVSNMSVNQADLKWDRFPEIWGDYINRFTDLRTDFAAYAVESAIKVFLSMICGRIAPSTKLYSYVIRLLFNGRMESIVGKEEVLKFHEKLSHDELCAWKCTSLYSILRYLQLVYPPTVYKSFACTGKADDSNTFFIAPENELGQMLALGSPNSLNVMLDCALESVLIRTVKKSEALGDVTKLWCAEHLLKFCVDMFDEDWQHFKMGEFEGSMVYGIVFKSSKKSPEGVLRGILKLCVQYFGLERQKEWGVSTETIETIQRLLGLIYSVVIRSSDSKQLISAFNGYIVENWKEIKLFVLKEAFVETIEICSPEQETDSLSRQKCCRKWDFLLERIEYKDVLYDEDSLLEFTIEYSFSGKKHDSLRGLSKSWATFRKSSTKESKQRNHLLSEIEETLIEEIRVVIWLSETYYFRYGSTKTSEERTEALFHSFRRLFRKVCENFGATTHEGTSVILCQSYKAKREGVKDDILLVVKVSREKPFSKVIYHQCSKCTGQIFVDDINPLNPGKSENTATAELIADILSPLTHVGLQFQSRFYKQLALWCYRIVY
eukprot:Nk52_evm3s153 gene=Nk52_evmTU3s153